MYIDKLPRLVDEYSNAAHRLIKRKPAAVKPDTYIDFHVDINTNYHVRISKQKNSFAKVYQPC